MDTRFSTQSLEAVASDLLAVAVRQDELDALAELDQRFDGRLIEHARTKQFKGSAGSTLSVPTFGRIAATELLLVGIGAGEAAQLREAAARVGKHARSARARSVAVQLGDDVGALVESIATGNYAYDRFKKESDRAPSIEELVLLGVSDSDSARSALDRANRRVAAQRFARELVNAPASEIYPESLAQAAKELEAFEHVTVEIWDEHRLEAEGCVGLLAVGGGSDRKPRLARVSYRPPNARAHIAFVGKGVTFDSGGLSLKPSNAMQTMRCDMGGAATVLAATRAIADLGLPIAVDTFIGCVENMVNGSSFKLGDVLTYKNGVSVEIHNTDAEGRLVLADCLIRACEVEGVTHVIDAATLTGACVVAIGSDFTGLFTSDDELSQQLSSAAADNGEGLWRLPLHAPYGDMLKADWAQLKNVGGRDAGASTAALFLQHFVEDVKWAHLDIAGSAFLEKGNARYAAGATGEMVRTLTTWAESLIQAD